MKVLVLNSGSSTLKFDVVEVYAAKGDREKSSKLAHGSIDRIGHESTLDFHTSSGASYRQKAAVIDHHDAVSQALAWLNSIDVQTSGQIRVKIEAVGHRIVHGGDRFVSPTLIDDSVLSALKSLNELAPLHNPAALQGIRAARAVLGPNIPMVAAFDTAFHNSLPEYAATYALPYELAERHQVRRYGFHGIAHEYMLRRYAEIANISTNNATLITLQLGNGCSATSIRNGRSVDTSMGFTPLEGLVMGTRSGDLDPGIVGYLARKEGASIDEVERWLNERSGLLGLSGRSSDMRDLIETMEQDRRTAVAVEVFCYRVRKYIGAYMVALGGADAIVFGGGIGENAPDIRTRICEGMEWLGIQLDQARNAATIGKEGRISANDSKIHIYVILVDESILIAQSTVECIFQGEPEKKKMGESLL
ncbi:MAG: acetate kinase [Candidatus Tectomicrobia bacterium]|nr:acetate kinase [Candidatus Tectomicrobia bacterium]